MKQIALFFVLLLFFYGCGGSSQDGSELPQNGDQQVVSLDCDTSVVWRAMLHPVGGGSFVGIRVIALENGKRFSFEYNSRLDATKDMMLLAEGDTVVYRGNEIISVMWIEPKEL